MNIQDLLQSLFARDPNLELDASDLKQALLEQPPFVIDIREHDELLSTGKLQGAEHIPMSRLIQELPAQVNDRDRDIVLYCASGSRSYTSAKHLQGMGFARVRSLRGGMSALRREGLPIVAA